MITTKTYYIENSEDLDVALELMKGIIPCFIDREYIEMNYSEVEIIAKAEHREIIENILAPLM